MELKPTEQRLYDALSNGELHQKKDLLLLLDDDLAGDAVLRTHIYNLRKKIAQQGLDIICQYLRRRYYYRLIRPITSAE